ncbi:MAG: phytoene/squalene synthase family protein [Bacteroidia bacterium]|nr:phytoene/squalene synthase family protein [Bacteroidia bacterium]
MFELFEETTAGCSRLVTNKYSTSFSLGIKLLAKENRWAVYAIYGMVRFADEIVDTFEREDKAELLAKFRADTFEALEKRISLNPILHQFQKAALKFNIGNDLITPFFESMSEDLEKKKHNDNSYSDYIYGSAEVVGLMCLKVFCEGNHQMYDSLKSPARNLGAAFQKVNFLRDLKSDVEDLGRLYFPGMDMGTFNEESKNAIIEEVKSDFKKAYEGILRLPLGCRFGVYIAYIYYLKLLEKLERTNVKLLFEKRVRIDNKSKMIILATSYVRYKANAL